MAKRKKNANSAPTEWLPQPAANLTRINPTTRTGIDINMETSKLINIRTSTEENVTMVIGTSMGASTDNRIVPNWDARTGMSMRTSMPTADMGTSKVPSMASRANVAASSERARTQTVNGAFHNLRTLIPTEPIDR